MKFVFVAIALCSVQIVTSTSCYWNDGCPYKYFSNKTPYNFVRGDIRDSLVRQTGCEPISIWALIRHGKRNPGAEFANDIKAALVIKDYIVTSYEKGNCSLCAQDVENLRKWQDNGELYEKPFQLNEEGYQESEDIGRRLKQAFPELLSKLDTNDYLFRPAPGAYMADSIKGFVEGLSDRQLTIQPPRTDFDVLSPFETCDKYIADVRTNPKTFEESLKYMESSEYQASRDGIQKRLGIDYSLTDTNITALYDLCRYTTSGISFKFSPWCALFTSEDLEIIEYNYDLRNYYRNSYGAPENELFGQITLTDLLKSFREAKSGNGRKITSYISHATVMDMVFAALKLNKEDGPLTSSRRDPGRKWRSSKLAGFSSNLIVVLNKCNKGADDYNVVFYLNEEPLLSICKKGVCTWNDFEEKLSPFLKTNVDFCDSLVNPLLLHSHRNNVSMEISKYLVKIYK